MEPTRSVAVVVYCTQPQRVLVLRRPAARAAGWQFVTGRVEPSDADLRAACLRELREETGLPDPLELLDLGLESRFVGHDGRDYSQRVFAARYMAPLPPSATPEHEAAMWATPEAALALLRWDDDKDALRHLVARLRPDGPALL